jgi:membrane-bound ClpP family serine protease
MLIFVSIAMAGLLFLLVSAFLGGDQDVGGHEIGVDHDHDVHADYGQDAGPSPFSLRIIALFITSFGAVGAIARYYGAPYMISSFVGVAGGVGVGAIGWRLIKFFWEQQATSTVGRNEIIGIIGEVKTAIPISGIGQVSTVVKNQRMYSLARAKDSGAIEEGALVKVVEYQGDLFIVERLQTKTEEESKCCQ